MTYTSIIFWGVIGAALYLFNRQEKRHRFELSLFYTPEQYRERFGRPRRDVLESLLAVFVGGTLIEIGVLFSATFLSVMNHPEAREIVDKELLPQFLMSAVFIGGGIAAVIAGIRSLIKNFGYYKTKHG